MNDLICMWVIAVSTHFISPSIISPLNVRYHRAWNLPRYRSSCKWLSEIHVQEDRYLGKFQARWYRTFKGEMIDGEMKWVETAITHMQIKSFIARVSKSGSDYKVFGVVLNDGTPLK